MAECGPKYVCDSRSVRVAQMDGWMVEVINNGNDGDAIKFSVLHAFGYSVK